MPGPRRQRFFSWFAWAGTQHPRWVFAFVGLLSLVSLALIPGLNISTSRYGLVAEDNPYQSRLYEFYDRFGNPDAPLLVLSGGTAEQRRATADALVDKLQQLPELKGRILARLDPETVAEVLLLQAPDGMESLQRALPPGTKLAEVVEGGVPAWFAAAERQLYAQLEGDAASDASNAEVERGMRGFTSLARALDDHVAGRDGYQRLAALVGDADRGRWSGVDEFGYLAGEREPVHIVAMFPELPGYEGKDLEPIVERIRAVRDEVTAKTPDAVTVELTGLPALVVDELHALGKTLAQSSIAAGVGILLLFAFVFRSLRQTLFGLIPLFITVLVVLAFVRLFYGGLNLITSSFVSVLLGLGIDFAVHILARYGELRRAGESVVEAITQALLRTGPGIATGAVTTGLAFMTTMTTEFTAYAELGVITAVGLLVSVLLTFLLLPAMLKSVRGEERSAPPALPTFTLLTKAMEKSRFGVLLVGLGAAVAGAVVMPTITFNPRYFDFLPADAESSTGLVRIEYEPSISPMLANLTAADMEAARTMTTKLRAMPTVGAVQTATDLLPELTPTRLRALREFFAGQEDPDFAKLAARRTSVDELRPRITGIVDALDEVRFTLAGAGRPTQAVEQAKQAFLDLRGRLEQLDAAGVARLGRLDARMSEVLDRAWRVGRAVAERGGYAAEDLPPIFHKRFVAKDGKALAVYAFPNGQFWEHDVAGRFTRDVESVDPRASGLAMNHYAHERMIMDGFQRAAMVAGVLIMIVVLIDFRSVADASFALVPIACGWLWMIAAMYVFDLRFDAANMVSLPLVLGIAIDGGVHLMHRCRESAAMHGGVAHLDDLLRGTGAAVMLASVTTMIGFASLLVGDYGGARSIGLLMVTGVATCLLACLTILPALLVVFRRAR